MKQLVILVAATNAVGHVNACTGATLPLLRRGHRLIFVLESAFKGSKAPLGYVEHIYHGQPEFKANSSQKAALAGNPGEWMANFLFDKKIIGPYSAIEKTKNMIEFMYSDGNRAEYTRFNCAIRDAIELYKPDLIYFDSGALMPAIKYSGIPWVRNISTNPIFFILDKELPPGGSGLPSNADPNEWDNFQKARREVVHSKRYNDNFIVGLGYAPYPDDLLSPFTQVLTVYAYPEELNYSAIRRKGWFNLEVFNKNEQLLSSKEVSDLKCLVPKKFLNDTLDGRFSGKFIYLSMGTMGSVDLDLMKRLVKVLGTTNHKYIVSKGPRFTEFNLPRNMWGDRYVSQVKLLPHVHLVISHGGNNTVCESFAEGKPILVLPLFADQFDNAQRLVETGYGARLDSYHFTSDELNFAVNRLLYNGKLARKLSRASERIRAQSARHEELADKIESLIDGSSFTDQSLYQINSKSETKSHH